MTIQEDSHDEALMLSSLDRISEGVPYTPPRACHLLYHLVSTFRSPEIVEVAFGYGKATLFLAAAVKRRNGALRCVDLLGPPWKGRTAVDLLRQASLLDVSEVTVGRDARWYLLDLFRQRSGQWIDLAYLDLSHTVEVDSFVALALWTHIRAGGILVFDDLDWVPAVHGQADQEFSEPATSHVRVIFDYVSSLSDIAEKAEWGEKEVNWKWGFLRKRENDPASKAALRDLLHTLDQSYWRPY